MAISRCSDEEVRTRHFDGNSRKAERVRQMLRDAPVVNNDASAWTLILRPKSGAGDCLYIRLAADDMGKTPLALIQKYLGADVDATQWNMLAGQEIIMEEIPSSSGSDDED